MVQDQRGIRFLNQNANPVFSAPYTSGPSANYFNGRGMETSGNRGNAAFGTPANVQKNQAWAANFGNRLGNIDPGFTGDNNNISAPGTGFGDAVRRFGPGGAGSIGASIGNSVGGGASQPSQPAAQPSQRAPQSGYVRVSPGMYRGPDGKIVNSAQMPKPPAQAPMSRQPAIVAPQLGERPTMQGGVMSGIAQGSGIQNAKTMPGMGNRPQRPGGPGPQTGGPLVSALAGMDQPQAQDPEAAFRKFQIERGQMQQQAQGPQNYSLTRRMPDGRMVY